MESKGDLYDVKMPSASRPYKTRGKPIWWIPDSFAYRHGWHSTMPPILYRDAPRHGVWVPDAALTHEQRSLLEKAAAEE